MFYVNFATWRKQLQKTCEKVIEYTDHCLESTTHGFLAILPASAALSMVESAFGYLKSFCFAIEIGFMEPKTCHFHHSVQRISWKNQSIS